jgi:hypothetical protein
MKPQISTYLRLIAATAVAAALAACGGGGNDDAPAQAAAPTATAGSVGIALMTDAPACGMDEINVSIARIRLHKDFQATTSSSGWVDIPLTPAKRLNLLNPASVLTGITTDLATASIPTGIYTQMRLMIDVPITGNTTPNTIKLAGTTTAITLETPASLATDGVKFPIDINVTDGQKSNVVVDFDACNSILPKGTAYALRPLARAVPTTLNGISGFIDKSVLASGVTITAQNGGAIYTTTVPNPTTGEFMLPRILPGNYDVVIQGKGLATAVIGQVPVTASTTVPISTSAAPIKLATSATSSISGQITYSAGKAIPDSGTWVVASQIINASTAAAAPVPVATTVTYRFQPVDQATGNYTLNDLPRNSIQYAPYKPALGLVPVNVATSLGTAFYNVQADATNYSRVSTTASAKVGVATANATGINIAF